MATNKTAQAFQQLEEGLAELLESGDWQRYLKVQSQFHNYSFNVDPLLPKQHQAKTLAHEIGHSLLHSRSQYDNHIPRSKAELEAESVAFIVLHHFGIDSSDYSFPYVAGWQQGEDVLENLRQSGMRIQKAANQVIEWVESESSLQMLSAS